MKALSLFCLTLVLAAVPLAAQEHSELSDAQFLEVIRSWRQPGGKQTVATASGESKCNFHLTLEAARRLPQLDPESRSVLTSLLAPTQRDTSIVSPSGKFRIHFDTSGQHSPALLTSNNERIPYTAFAYADSLARFFDYSYEVEVNQHGYAAPPFERNRTEYNVFILDYGSTTYGQTFPVDVVPGSVPARYTCFIEIDNDFRGFYSKGMDGAKATAAHEFHHVVQLGGYGLWPNDTFIYEMTSTFFEEAVYPEVNDFYQYLNDFFNIPTRSLYQWRGYEAMPFILMLVEHYGTDVLRQTWEGMKSVEPLRAIDNTLKSTQYQSDLMTEFCRFASWNFYTGYRSSYKRGQGYPYAEDFPTMRVASTIPLANDAASFQGSITPLASQYFRAYRGPDTAAISISNTDVVAAFQKSGHSSTFTLDVRYGSFGSDFTPIDSSGLWAYKLTPHAGAQLCSNVFYKDAVRNPGAKPFPNPYNPAVDGVIRFPVSTTKAETRATLAIYTAGLELVIAIENHNVINDDVYGRFVTWDGRAQSGSIVSSGVYFYAISHGDDVSVGKITVINR